MSGLYFILQTSQHFLIDATTVTLGQGQGKVIQYISPDYMFCCPKYLRFSSKDFDLRGKWCCGGGCGGRGGNELKTWVILDRGDLMIVGLKVWHNGKQPFLLFRIHLNASQYDIFFVYFIFMSQIVLCVLHSNAVLSFHIDVVLTLSILHGAVGVRVI